jgi:penicillin-binding protein 1C
MSSYIAVSSITFGLLAVVATVLSADAASVRAYSEVRERHRSSEARLFDRHGEVIHELRVDARGRRLHWVALVDISPALVDTVLHSEDRRFRRHGGVDWLAAARALWEMATGGAPRGASTITMQLAALVDTGLRPSSGRRGPAQKWAQMRAAWSIEQRWSKAQILEAYLNLASFRGELQGIAAASRGLFDKAPSGLDGGESLLLAALLRAPNATADAVARRACGLAGSSDGDADCGRAARLAADALSGPPRLRQAVTLAPEVARRLLGGGDATSTLDAAIQRRVADSLWRQLAGLRDRGVNDGAALVVDNASGEVLAYAGNGGRRAESHYVDGVQAPRQAGSALKPFLYELAIERRLLTAASPLLDAAVDLPTPSGLYAPQNYDRDFNGWVSARTALAASLNVPAVRVAMLTGVDAYVEHLRRFGFSGLTEDGDYYGHALALGSGEVTLWQLVNAYRTLANGGVRTPLTLTQLAAPTAVPSDSRQRVADPDAAFIVADMLADRAARSPTFGLDNALATPYWSAAKTGTSKDMRDNWCVGFSRRYTVGVWVGNFDGRPMRNVSGVTGAAPVWLEIMNHLNGADGSAAPVPPSGVVRAAVSFDPPFETPREEWFVAGTQAGRMVIADGPVRRPRIVYPGDGLVVAIDPDMPPGRQRLPLAMEPRHAGLRWRLDDVWLAPDTDGWQPSPGEHALELVDGAGLPIDRVVFTVRGAAARALN